MVARCPQEHPRNHNRREHGSEHAKREGERKALNQTLSEPEEDNRGNQARDIRVADGEPCAEKSVLYRIAQFLATAQLLFHALKNQNIGIHCKTHGEDKARNARRGERHRDQFIDCKHERNVNGKRHNSKDTGQAGSKKEKNTENQEKKQKRKETIS